MQKTLIALAALAVSGTALAQSSVTIYGAVDNSFTRVTNKGGASASGLSSGGGGSIGSKLGFKGDEDLGGGLKASFKLEMGLETSSGANGVPGSSNNFTIVAPGGGLRFDRAAYVALSGGFGEVRLGRDLVASFINDVIYDPFLTYGVGSSLNFPLGVVADAKSASSLFRVSNAVSYLTPNFGGLTAQIQFAPSEQASNTGIAKRDGRVTTGRVAYDKGPLSASVSAGKADQSSGVIGQDITTANAGASFDFGVVKVMGEFARFKVDNFTGVSGVDLTTNIVTLGAIAPVGPGKIKLGVSRAERKTDGVTAKPETTKVAVGYDYSLSKRTSLFTTVAYVRNKDGSAVSASQGGVAGFGGAPAVANQRSIGYDVGLLHSF
jgi:predicted porin